MRKISTLLFFSACAFLFACNKPNNKAQTQPYAIAGVDDIQLMQGEPDSWSLEIRSIGPVYETVTLSITGLPQGVTATMTKSEGQPTFFSTVVFNNTNALPGSYPCVLTASSPEAGASTYNFMVKISNPIICGLIQNFNGYTSCDTTPFLSNIVTLSPPIEDSINTVQINNFANNGIDVAADIDCSNSTISIPMQWFNGNTVSVIGSGSFTGGSNITINYTITVNGSPTNCTLYLQPD